MSLKNNITNERLSKRFDNPFALVNYAIGLARAMVLRGDGLEENPANEVLELIAKGHNFEADLEDDLDDEEDEDEEDEEESV